MQVNIVLQARQPGSSIKPITYALPLVVDSASTINDAPICFILKASSTMSQKLWWQLHGKSLSDRP